MSHHLAPLSLRLLSCTIALLLSLKAAGEPPAKERAATQPVRLTLEGRLQALACSPDGKTLATVTWAAASRTMIRLRDSTSGAVLGEADTGWANPGFARFSPDGKKLALLEMTNQVTDPSFLIRLWDVTTDRRLNNPRILHPDVPFGPRTVHHFAFSPDGKTLAAGTPPEIVCLWDTGTGKLTRGFYGGVAAGFSADGRWLVAVTHDGQIRRFEYPACKLTGRADPDHRVDYLYVTHVAFAPDGRLVALSDNWTTLVKDMGTGRTVCRVSRQALGVPRSFSPDGKLLILTAGDGSHFIDIATGRERAWQQGVDGPAEFLGEGWYVACVGAKSIVIGQTATILAKAESAPETPRTTPPGVDLEAELLVRKARYALDLMWDSPQDWSDRIHFDHEYDDGYPEPPQVDLMLRIRNIGKKPLTIRHSSDEHPTLYLAGPGAVNLPWVPRQVPGIFARPPEPELQTRTLTPGQSLSIPIKDLHSDVQAFWLLPGEYAIGGYYEASIKPAAAADRAGDGFGYITILIRPAKVTVFLDDHPSIDEPPAQIWRPPPPGSPFIPDKESMELREKLARPAYLKNGWAAGTPLKKALHFLSERYDLRIHFDDAAFKRMGKERIGEAKIALRPLSDVRLRAILDLLLNQVDAGMELRKDAVWIVPLSKPQSLAERLGRAGRWSREQLRRAISLKQGIAAGTPLCKALDTVAEQSGLTLFVDARAFERAGTKNIDNQPVALEPQENVRAAKVLKQLLDQIGATLELREDLVLVVPKDKG